MRFAVFVLVPIAVLSFGACGSPPDRQFLDNTTHKPMSPVDNAFVNEVQRAVDRPLDDADATLASITGVLTCSLGQRSAAVTAHRPGMSAPQRETTTAAMRLAWPGSNLCIARAAADRAAREGAEAAKAAAEAQTRLDQEAARKRQESTTTRTTLPSPRTSSSEPGPICDLNGPPKINARHEITNRDCGYIDRLGNKRSHDPWIDDQLKAARGEKSPYQLQREQQRTQSTTIPSPSTKTSSSPVETSSSSTSDGDSGGGPVKESNRQDHENQRSCASGDTCAEGN